MRVLLNGEPHTIPDSCTIAELLSRLGLEGRRIAVEVNREIVPRSSFGERRLCEADRIEIVHFVGGG
jgi:thiamine biosynthesis protein ThiS